MNWRVFGPRRTVTATGEVCWSQEMRVGSCGRPLGERVALHRAHTEHGTRGVFTGVETCGNAIACLKCARKVRAEKADNIGHVICGHLADGGYALLLSLTFAHSLVDEIEDSLSDAMTAWSSMVATRRWKKLMSWLGDQGWIRTTESTQSDANGHHPHHHICLLIDRGVGHGPEDPLELEDVRQEIYECWSLALDKLDREAHHSSIGVDLKPIRDDRGVGAYVSKVQLELTRSDIKSGRNGSRSMWEVALDAADGCDQSLAIWCDYVRAAKSRRWISTSRGLWAKHGINDRADEEIAEDDPEDAETIAFIEPAVYTAAAKAETTVLTELRHLAEANATAQVLATVLGRRLGRTVQLRRLDGVDQIPTLGWGPPPKPVQRSMSSRE